MKILTIEDADELYRRIYRYHFGRDGEVLPAAFMVSRKPDNNISVDLAKLTTPEETLARGKKDSSYYGLGVLAAGYPRRLGFQVWHSPSVDNYAHSVIEGQNTKDKCRNLAVNTKVIRRPDR